jgi:Zn-dependent protease
MYQHGPASIVRLPGSLDRSAICAGRRKREARRARVCAGFVSGDVGPNLSTVYTSVKEKVPDDWGPFAAWRMVELHGQQVVHAYLHPGATADDPQVSDWLARWPGPRYLQDGPYGVEATLVRRVAPRPHERWWLHALLLALTLLTATLAGAWMSPGNPLAMTNASVAGQAIPVPARLTPLALAPGLWFSVPLLCILGAHELGHWAFARRHAMDASPPYFAPAPWVLSPLGTFGAFIRLRSPLINRAALLDMGAAGPVISFVLSIPVYAAGLALSHGQPVTIPGGARLVAMFSGDILPLGESPLLWALRALSPLAEAQTIVLHPMAVAGWFGLFFTALNLFPISQLDGGHVAYALSPRLHVAASRLTLGVLLVMGAWYPGWWVWAALVLLIGRGRLAHPPVWDPSFRLNGPRRAVAWACFVLFLLAWVPVPVPLP